MATAPATGAPADALIMALRGATPMQGQASTLKFYDNPENSVYTPRVRPVYVPPPLPPGLNIGPQLPAPAPPPAPAPNPPALAPVAPTPIAPAPPRQLPPFVQPKTSPIEPDAPDVPDYTDDLFDDRVFEAEPDPADPGPVADAIAVDEPKVIDIVDLPPLEADVSAPPPVPPSPAPRPPRSTADYDPPVLEADPDPPVLEADPDPTVYDIPTGEIEVKTGVTDAYKAARDALNNASDVTAVNPLDELSSYVDLLNTDITSTLPTVDAPVQEDASTINTIRDANSVTQIDPLTELEDYAALLNTDITSTLPAAVAEDTVQPSVAVDTATQGLTQRDLDEMALFDMLSQQLLTGNDYWDQLLMDDPYLQER